MTRSISASSSMATTQRWYWCASAMRARAFHLKTRKKSLINLSAPRARLPRRYAGRGWDSTSVAAILKLWGAGSGWKSVSLGRVQSSASTCRVSRPLFQWRSHMILNNPKSAIFLEPVPPQSRQPHKVLVVDDDPVIRDMMVDIRQRHVIVMMSALDRIDEAMRCKVEAVMPKPFLVDDVVRVLEPYQETLQSPPPIVIL